MKIRLTSITIALTVLFSTTVSAQYPSFADLVEKLIPSVVNISTTITKDETTTDFTSEQEALGSGFILNKEGYIVTNQHVIDKAQTINVTLYNNELYEATIIGEDKKTDLALLKINTSTPLSPITFGDSDAMRVGDWILAIGNPFGLGGSVTAGIVSAKSRDIEAGSYDNFIQTDAAINQGNSGGPMFNLKGEVIGVNSAIFSTTGNSMGVGFATPSKMAQWVIDQLRRDGKVTRGWIGISIQPNPLQTNGILVSRVTDNSPAQQAGITPGDIISKFNNIPLNNATNLSRIIAESAIGEILNLEIIRNNQNINIKVVAEKMPDEIASPQTDTTQNKKEKKEEQISSPLGIKVANITPELLTQHNLPSNSKGVIVIGIDEQSDGFLKGIQVGNLISKVDKKEVFDIISFNDYIKQAQNEHNRPVLLTIQNTETEHFVAVKLNP